MRWSALILAGGESRRMGRDKAWLEIEGQPLLLRAVSTVRAAGVEEVIISGRSGVDYSKVGCPVLIDAEPGLGPLAGIELGLAACKCPLLLVLAVDLPNMAAAFLRRLWAQCDAHTGVVSRLDGELEPLASIYPKNCHALARRCLASSRRSARGFASACYNQGAVRLLDIAPSEAGYFVNWNRPGEWPDPGHGP